MITRLGEVTAAQGMAESALSQEIAPTGIEAGQETDAMTLDGTVIVVATEIVLEVATSVVGTTEAAAVVVIEVRVVIGIDHAAVTDTGLAAGTDMAQQVIKVLEDGSHGLISNELVIVVVSRDILEKSVRHRQRLSCSIARD